MPIPLPGLFRAGQITASPSEETQSSTRKPSAVQRARLGWELIAIAAQERAGLSQASSEAWIADFIPKREKEASAWAEYVQQVQTAERSAPDLRMLQRIAAAAPTPGSRPLKALALLFQEEDLEFFAEGLLDLGRRQLGEQPELARAALQAASEISFTASRAQSLLDGSMGRGGVGARFESQAPRLLRELASPLLLTSFGAGIFFGRVASLATLSRFGSFGWGSLLASEGAALAVEVPALVLARRLGERFLRGGAELLAPREVGHDLVAAYGPFALLRATGNALNLGGPWLRRNLGLQGERGRRAFSGLRLGAELGSLALGHRCNEAVGLEAPTSGAQAFFQGLLSLVHMRSAGRLVEGIGLGSLGPLWEARRYALWSRSRDGIFGDFHVFPELALAGPPLGRFVPASRDLRRFEPMLMSGEGEGEGPRGGGGGSSPTPSRRALVLQMFGQNLGEYSKAAENHDTFLGRVAGKLHHILEKPELVQDEFFAQALAEMESELEAVQEQSGVALRTYAQLKVLLGRGGEESGLPSEAGKHIDNIAKDEAARGALTSALVRMKEVFQQARQFGWNEELYGQLVQAKNNLNHLYQNTSWRVPGLDRLLRRGDSMALLQRRQGALLGLAVFDGHETATVRDLRDPKAPPGFAGNLELELIHQSVLAAARRAWKPKSLDAEVLSLASRFGASEESAAAMLLSAATVRRLVEGGPKSSDLLEWMSSRDEANYFADRLLQLRTLRSMNAEPGRGLHQLAIASSASDYLFTGLQVFLQSQGDPARLNAGLQAARRSKVLGFHPSVAASFFGAAQGRKKLPERLWSATLDQGEYLRRALEP